MATNFKTDESFLEKISIGAIGTKKVFEDLSHNQHRPIELERGSMNYKIWKAIKIKRIRVPDILCVDCGKRIESRAKTNLEITMSHSINDMDRAWDFGLNDEDFVALVACKKCGDKPIDWCASNLVQYIKVSELRTAFNEGKIKQEAVKGAQEGFETRITWYAATASSDGTISFISTDEDKKPKIQFKRTLDGRTISLSLLKSKGLVRISPLVKVDSNITEDEIIAAVVPVMHNFACDKKATSDSYVEKLKSISLSERYAAAKALSYFTLTEPHIETLKAKLKEEEEHIYVKMECAATLSRNNIAEGFAFISSCLKNEQLVQRLEAVIISSEIKTQESFNLLKNCVLDKEQHHEIRAGAAWALGELGQTEGISTLISSFNSLEEIIKVEAARALAKFSKIRANDLIPFLKETSPTEKPGLAWAISRAEFKIRDLLPFLTDEESRKWISYIIGVQDKEKHLEEIESLREKDSEVYFAVTVLWKIMESWIFGLEEY